MIKWQIAQWIVDNLPAILLLVGGIWRFGVKLNAIKKNVDAIPIIQDKVNVIMTNHLKHIEEELLSIKTRLKKIEEGQKNGSTTAERS